MKCFITLNDSEVVPAQLLLALIVLTRGVVYSPPSHNNGSITERSLGGAGSWNFIVETQTESVCLSVCLKPRNADMICLIPLLSK